MPDAGGTMVNSTGPRLLILACSARKRGRSGPALEVYDGPTFRVLRKALTASVDDVTTFVLSARDGLYDAKFEIAPYDREMTTARAEDLRAAVRAILEEMADHPWSEVYIEVGKVYRRALPDEETFARLFECPIFWGAGGIGVRCRQLKAWLHKPREISWTQQKLI